MPINKSEMKVVIDGAGEIGSHLAKLLVREGNEVSVIDNDRGRLDALSSSVDIEPIEENLLPLRHLRRRESPSATFL